MSAVNEVRAAVAVKGRFYPTTDGMERRGIIEPLAICGQRTGFLADYSAAIAKICVHHSSSQVILIGPPPSSQRNVGDEYTLLRPLAIVTL